VAEIGIKLAVLTLTTITNNMGGNLWIQSDHPGNVDTRQLKIGRGTKYSGANSFAGLTASPPSQTRHGAVDRGGRVKLVCLHLDGSQSTTTQAFPYEVLVRFSGLAARECSAQSSGVAHTLTIPEEHADPGEIRRVLFRILNTWDPIADTVGDCAAPQDFSFSETVRTLQAHYHLEINTEPKLLLSRINTYIKKHVLTAHQVTDVMNSIPASSPLMKHMLRNIWKYEPEVDMSQDDWNEILQVSRSKPAIQDMMKECFLENRTWLRTLKAFSTTESEVITSVSRSR